MLLLILILQVACAIAGIVLGIYGFCGNGPLNKYASMASLIFAVHSVVFAILYRSKYKSTPSRPKEDSDMADQTPSQNEEDCTAPKEEGNQLWAKVVDSAVAESAPQLTLVQKTQALTQATFLNDFCMLVHGRNQTWWRNPKTGEALDRNVGEMLMLMVSELAEAMEGHRKNLMDDHLPHRKMLEVEMADTIIRIFDFCGGFGLDLGGAFVDKMAYNANRADHKPEARLAPGGKAY